MFVEIGEAKKNSSNYFNKQILISGTVIEIEKISSSRCKYMLLDTKGDKILVNSVHGCPAINKTYSVKGIVVKDGVSFLVYFKEETRKLKTIPALSETVEVKEQDIVVDEDEYIMEIDDADAEMEFVIYEEDEQEYEEEEVYFIVEDMPKFKSGDLNNFRMYIQENLQYPDSAAAKGISGKVFVQFVVNSTGYVKNVKIVRSADPYLDAEALRVIKSSPKWVPGKQRGKPVNVQFTFPIVFIAQ